MENEKRIKIYPDMQQDRLQKLINGEKHDVKELIELKEIITDNLRGEGGTRWLHNKIEISVREQGVNIDQNDIREEKLRSNEMVRDCIKELFNELIISSRKADPKQAELLQFVSNQSTELGDLRVDWDDKKRINSYNDIIENRENREKKNSLEEIFKAKMGLPIYSKFLNAIKLKNIKINRLNGKLEEIEKQMRVPVKKRPQYTIAPNITIRELPSSGYYHCLEYNTDNKNLFFDEITNGNLKRIKIESVLLNNKSEFYGYTQEFIEELAHAHPFSNIAFYEFFNKEPIRNLLMTDLRRRQLINENDRVIVYMSHAFLDCNYGFATINIAGSDKPFDKLMFFQAVKDNQFLNVVECGEILHKDIKLRLGNDSVGSILDSLDNILLRDLKSIHYAQPNKSLTPVDIVKKGEVFGFIPDDARHYDANLEVGGRLFSMRTQVRNPDDDIVEELIKNFINARNTAQNTVRNVHMAGDPLNTLLKVPYCCMDGLEIANIITTIPTDHIAAPNDENANDENVKDAIKQANNLKMATREVINELIDKSLGINNQQ